MITLLILILFKIDLCIEQMLCLPLLELCLVAIFVQPLFEKDKWSGFSGYVNFLKKQYF